MGQSQLQADPDSLRVMVLSGKSNGHKPIVGPALEEGLNLPC